jgi:SAM-dependent methyltransferase
LARDVVHHIDEPERFIDECARVLAPGGRIDVLEPCRYNPLIALHALTQRAERGELRSTEAFLCGQLERRFRLGATARHQPLPIHRLVLHPELGRPRLAEGAFTRRMLETVEGLAGKLMPRFAWAYIHVRAFHREEAPCTS